MNHLTRNAQILGLALMATAAVGCGNPLTVTTWLELAPGSQMEVLGNVTPLQGGVFTRIDVDMSDLLHLTGTIQVEQVRIAGEGGLFGSLCLRKDTLNGLPGSFSFDVLTNTQIVDFPFATIASSTFLDTFGMGEIASLASPAGLQFPTDLALFAPVFETGSMDGVVNLPVTLEQELEIVEGMAVPAVVDLVLVSSSQPPVIDGAALLDYCEPKWALQGEPLPYVINPKGTYLHHVNETNPQPPLVIDLAEIDVLPGDTLRITREGRWEGFFQGNQQRVAAVFSSTDQLNPVVPPAIAWVNFWHWLTFQSNRVPGAIEAGLNVVTPLTFAYWNRTDIPQDFEITGTVEVVVPGNAQYLFLSPIDIAYSDNITSSLRVSLSVEPAPGS
ncbi:MAG: hypothetical protein GY946_24570 [bacterium]|nr:hypothetical protein [bacterium]